MASRVIRTALSDPPDLHVERLARFLLILDKLGASGHKLAAQCHQMIDRLLPLLHFIPPFIQPQRQQDRAYNHHAFHEDAKPGDLSLQFSPIR